MKKKIANPEKIDWDSAVEKWASREETDCLLQRDQEKRFVCYQLIKKKWLVPYSSGKRGASNPNPPEVVYSIIANSDFYHRNKYRFEFLEATYQSRNYGYEFYWKSIEAPKEVNQEIIIKNRMKVCRRMVTKMKNKIEQFEHEQHKQLFPNWEHQAYKKFIEKRDKYQNELDLLELELKQFDGGS